MWPEPHPQPLSREERGADFPLSLWERGPGGEVPE